MNPTIDERPVTHIENGEKPITLLPEDFAADLLSEGFDG